jgi:hypothetical protein
MYACVDTEGDYGIGKDVGAARESYENDIQALNECEGFRIVQVTLQVSVPAVAELTGVVSDSGEPTGLTTAIESPG